MKFGIFHAVLFLILGTAFWLVPEDLNPATPGLQQQLAGGICCGLSAIIGVCLTVIHLLRRKPKKKEKKRKFKGLWEVVFRDSGEQDILDGNIF